ncbi:MAG: cobalt-precorrin-6A reductase [Leptolyngbya sp. SIO4C1]|nr:cobalt-precorrin-6A reductase [Leptolyngbya sp. SIO4C1]
MKLGQQVWLIGGTRESAVLARAIAAIPASCVITVTTAAAAALYPEVEPLTLWVGRLRPETLDQFLQQQRIGAILDASHPFAVTISQLAIAAAVKHQLPYLRYERPAVADELADSSSRSARTVESYAALFEQAGLLGQRALLTIGYRALAQFRPYQTKATLFARILPSAVALEAALAAGFSPARLIAIRPPLSLALERALWQQWQISTVVAKASGSAGGEAIKRQLATELNVQLWLIRRPEVAYPQVAKTLSEAISFCRAFATDSISSG